MGPITILPQPVAAVDGKGARGLLIYRLRAEPPALRHSRTFPMNAKCCALESILFQFNSFSISHREEGKRRRRLRLRPDRGGIEFRLK